MRACTHKCNDSFFSAIDTERKAYWLGFLYADGNVSRGKYSFQTRLALTEDDSDIVEELKKDLEATHNISRWKAHGYPNSKPLKVLTITSRKMFEDLGRLGCYPRKSLTLRFPTSNQVPDNLLRHFVRGYFDGDGCITFRVLSESKRPFLQIEGTKEFLESLRRHLRLHGISADSELYKRHKDRPTNAYNLRIGHAKGVKSMYHFFYDDATFWMKRKRDRFDSWIALESTRKDKDSACQGRRRVLSLLQVLDVRKRLSEKQSMRSISLHFGCSMGTISKIKAGDTYRDYV